MQNRYEPLYETTRGSEVENTHFGAIVVSNAEGEVLASVGGPQQMVFGRSTFKPFQALSWVAGDGVRKLGLSDRHIALACASHNGEDRHVEGVSEMLAAAGLGIGALKCGCHVPYRYQFFDKHPHPDEVFDARHHNCSGKHAGFLAAAVAQGLSAEAYTDAGHPLQQKIRAATLEVCNLREDQLYSGVDGCSAPAFAMPLLNTAQGFARLACDRASRWGEALNTICDAMIKHPGLVSGEGRNDEALMRFGAGDWVAKVGADGFQSVASKSRGEAISVKVADTGANARYAVTVAAMEQRGWLSAAQREALRPWLFADIVNAAGLRVGERRCVFRLG
jgi:L-asparaginase II